MPCVAPRTYGRKMSFHGVARNARAGVLDLHADERSALDGADGDAVALPLAHVLHRVVLEVRDDARQDAHAARSSTPREVLDAQLDPGALGGRLDASRHVLDDRPDVGARAGSRSGACARELEQAVDDVADALLVAERSVDQLAYAERPRCRAWRRARAPSASRRPGSGCRARRAPRRLPVPSPVIPAERAWSLDERAVAAQLPPDEERSEEREQHARRVQPVPDPAGVSADGLDSQRQLAPILRVELDGAVAASDTRSACSRRCEEARA